MSADRVSEALDIAREHLEWCGKRGVFADEVMRAIGINDPGPRRVGRYGSLRLEALAAAWLSLTQGEDDERRAA
jgi:hypothetical protein